VVRRFNAASEGHLRPRQHRFVLERGIKPGLDRGTTRRLLLPREDLGWVQERSRLLIEEIRRRGHPVHGDLQDLMPLESATTDRRPDDVSTDELLAATEATLTALAAALAASRRRARRRAPADGGRSPAALAGSARAATFRLEKAVLLRARRHPLLARAVRAYLRRTSGA
jgi:hypothetical protein